MYQEIYDSAIENFNNKRENDMRFSVLTLLALETGARVSDLLNLKWSNINFDMKEINYTNKKSKKKQSQCLSIKLLDKIKLFKEVSGVVGLMDGYIFYNEKKGTVMSRITANRRSQKEYKINFHELRKISAKRIAGAKGVVMACKFLGHSRVSTTDIYLGVSDAEYKRQMRELYTD